MDYKMKRAASAKVGKKFAAALSAAVLVAPTVASAVQPMVALAEDVHTWAEGETFSVQFFDDSEDSQPAKTYTATVGEDTDEASWEGSYTPSKAGKVFVGWVTTDGTPIDIDVDYTETVSTITLANVSEFVTAPGATLRLNAVWASSFEISYDANGGKGEMTNKTVVDVTKVDPEDPTEIADSEFTGQDGKVQDGWTLTVDGANYFVPAYADVNTQLLSVDDFKTPVKYTTKKDGVTVDATLLAIGSDYDQLQLNANWVDQYTGVYDANGGEFKFPESKLTFTFYSNDDLKGVGTLLDAKKPKTNDVQFIGWNTKADASGKFISTHKEAAAAVRAGDLTPVDGKVTLYAVWRSVDATGTINFDANLPEGVSMDGQVPPITDVATNTSDKIMPLKKAVSTGSNYDYVLGEGVHKLFAGWTYGGQDIEVTESDEEGVAIPAWLKSTVLAQGTVDNQVTLKAKWVDTYAVRTVAKQAADGAVKNVDVTGTDYYMEGDDLLVAPEAVYPSNDALYSFAGWAVTEGGAAKYKAGDKLKAEDAKDNVITLYATYARKDVKYKVKFQAADASSGSMAGVNLTTGKGEKLPANQYKKNNAVFAGWKVDDTDVILEDGASQDQIDSIVKNAGQTVTLTAQWNDKYTVKYVGGDTVAIRNEVKGTTASTDAVQGVESELAECGFTREGYTFIGWAAKPGVAYDAPYSDFVTSTKDLDKVATPGGTVTVYAVWQKGTIAEPEAEVTKEALQKSVEAAKAVKPEDYTEETAKAFTDALKAAEDVLADEKATQAQVDDANLNLKLAQAALREKPAPVNKDALAATVLAASLIDPDDYTEESLEPFAAALAASTLVLADEDATQADVDAANVTLALTMAALQPIPADGWVQEGNNSWKYVKGGKNVADSWLNVDGEWFRFDENGYMMDGWVKDGDNWYFLSQEHDGKFGAMKTGWVMSDGKWYYMNPNEGGPKGAMMTGWQQVNGKWYYLYEQTGAPKGSCAISTTTPDGYRVDASGAWIQ